MARQGNASRRTAVAPAADQSGTGAELRQAMAQRGRSPTGNHGAVKPQCGNPLIFGRIPTSALM